MTDSQEGWLVNIKSSLKKDTAAWLVTFAIGILGLFSTQITESVRFALNRADLRTQQYEETATEISRFMFWAELSAEFIENDWTTKATMTELLNKYNQSVTTIREKEYVHQAWLRRFWGADAAEQFKVFMESVRQFDSTIHSLNDEFEKVNVEGAKSKIDRKRAEEALVKIRPAIDNLRSRGNALLAAIS